MSPLRDPTVHLLCLTSVSFRDVQHVEEETQLARDAKLSTAQMLQEAATKRLEKEENLQHGIAVGIGDVGLQAGERGAIVEPEVEVFESDL